MVRGRGWRRLGGRGIVVVVVLLLAAGGAGAWLLLRPSDAQAAQTMTATVETGTFQQTVAATGTLAAAKEADLDFGVSGRVASVRVSAGDKVAKGDVLARLDTTSLEAALTSAKAQLAAAQAQYDQDVDDDADDTMTASDSADVSSAESSLSQAEDDLAAATLRATISGTVASVALTVDDQVGGSSTSSSSSSNASGGESSASSTVSSSTTSSDGAVVIVSPNRFKVAADVSADDIASVKKGLQVQVTPSGATEAVFGTVTSVGLVAEVSTSGAATFPVVVTLTGSQSGLYVGTSATVAIVTKQVTDVLSVPALALHTSGESTYVEKLVDAKKVKTTVTVGETYGSSTVITKGISSGDEVVLGSMRIPAGGSDSVGGQQQEGGGFGGSGGGGPPSGDFGGGGLGGDGN